MCDHFSLLIYCQFKKKINLYDGKSIYKNWYVKLQMDYLNLFSFINRTNKNVLI